MKLWSSLVWILALSILVSSCEFNCTVGSPKEVKGVVKIKDGTRLYNNIELDAHKVKVGKAYLVFENGERVPDNNVVDFKKAVKVLIMVDSGWVDQNGKVMLGASEKIMAEDGTLLLDESDLFALKYMDGVSKADAKALGLTAHITLKENTPPTSFIVSFRVWDKGGEGHVTGSYKLFSK